MRSSFIATLTELAANDPRIALLTGDLGYMALEPFFERFPDRSFNAGVAEQNMIGVAMGLADAGLIPFVYSIVPFAALRPYELIRNGPGLHRLQVRVVGVGTGFEYGNNGPTHYGIDDVGVMRLQPDIAIISPADPVQTRSALLATWDLPGAVYYRLGKDDNLVIPGLDGRFRLGRVECIGEGEDLLIVALGSITAEAVAASERLRTRGIACTVAVVASMNPSPDADLAALLRRFPVAMTIEAHYVTGGLGSLVSEIVAEEGIGCRVVRHGIRRLRPGESGSQAYLHRVHGLNRDALVESALGALKRIDGRDQSVTLRPQPKNPSRS